MARPTKEVDIIALFELYSKGLTDGEIAKSLGVARTSIINRRQEFGLKANRKQGERGPSIKEDEMYWVAVRRSLQYIGKYIAQAARDYYEETKDFERFFISMVMEPRPMFHAIPGPFAGDPEKINYTNIDYITDFEKTMEYTCLSGCPGIAVIKLAKVYKSASEELCMSLAREAVENAGFVSAYATVSEVEHCMPPEAHKTFWENIHLDAREWAPVKEKTSIKIPKALRQSKESAGRTGKRGKGGGTQSVRNAQAYQAALGY